MRRVGPLDRVGDRAEEEAELREVIDLARAVGDVRLEGQASSVLGFALYRGSRHEEARELLPAAIECARVAGDFETEATGSGNLGNVLEVIEGSEAAIPYHERQLELSRQHGFGKWEGNALGNLSIAYDILGQVDRALDLARERLDVHEKCGYGLGVAHGYGQLGSIHAQLGHHEEARRYLEHGLAANKELGCRRSASYDVANLGSLAETTGMFEEAWRRFGDAAAMAHGMGDRNLGLAMDIGLAELHARLGDLEGANTMARGAMAMAKASQSPRGRAATAQICGWIHRLRDEPAEARAAYALAVEEGWPSQVARGNLGLGLLLMDAGQEDEAGPCLDLALKLGRETQEHSTALLALLAKGDVTEAIALLDEMGARLPYATVMEARFLLWKATGERAHLDEAHERLLFLRDHAPEAYRETILTVLPLHREIVAAWEAS